MKPKTIHRVGGAVDVGNLPLLNRFLYEKLQGYAERTRKGTPRGDRIGFPKAKYWAALIALTNTPLQEAARVVGITYGLLRRWRSEVEFKALVASLREEFVDTVFMPYIRRTWEAVRQRLNHEMELSLDELERLPGPPRERRYDGDLGDVRTYHWGLLDAIYDRVQKPQLREWPERLLRLYVLGVIEDILSLQGYDMRPTQAQRARGLRMSIGSSLDNITAAIKLKTAAKDEETLYTQKMAMLDVGRLRRIVDTLLAEMEGTRTTDGAERPAVAQRRERAK